MDEDEALFARPAQRLRPAEDNHHRAHQPAPARPVATPQHQHWHPQGNSSLLSPTTTPHAEHLLHRPETAAEASQVFRWLACSFKGGMLGVAAYDRLSNQLSVLEVAEDSKGHCAFQMLQYIKLQVDPQVIIVSAGAEAALVEAAKAAAAAATGATALVEEGYEVTVQLQRPSMFTYSKALQMVNAVQLKSWQNQPHPHQASTARSNSSRVQAFAAAGLIDLSAQQQVAALGALVAVLLQLQEEEGSAEGAGVLLVDNINEMKLEGHLVVDGHSLAALDVFKEEEHPSAMGIGSSKEGVSVYGLLQRCVTGMGRRLLRQWFLRPVVQLDVIADRHDTLELLVAAPTTNDALRAAMKKLQDLPKLVARLRLSQARPQLTTLMQLHDSINQLLTLRAAMEALAPRAASEDPAAAAGNTAEGPGSGGGGPWDREHISGRPAGIWQCQGNRAPQPGSMFDGPETAAAAGFFSEPADMTRAWGRGDGLSTGYFDSPAAPAYGFNAASAPGARPSQAAQVSAGGSAAGGGTAGAGGGTLGPASPWDNLSITQKILQGIRPDLSNCCALIADVLDLKFAMEGCMVQPGVCQPLDDLKATYDQLPELLTQVVEQELMRVPSHVARRYSKQLWSVVYIPQVGFVMSVSGGKLSEELVELLPDYQLAFMGEDGPAGVTAAAAGGQAGAAAAAAAAEDSAGLDLDRSCAYYTCHVTQQLNAQYGDLQHKIQDLEASICTELIKRLLQHGPALSAASASVAELDCLCSLAAAARELGYCRPKLVKESVIFIEGGRHPLCELLAPGRFIDNDTKLGMLPAQSGSGAAAQDTGMGEAEGGTQPGSSNPRMLLITGPNASGKSIYMKQVALLVYMAHIGSFVPARSAVVGLTDRILTRLPGVESVAQHTSSFMTDLAQVSTILSRATSRSLVLLDEFGKGTLTSDGVGLLAAVLQHYAAQPQPPLLLACTHFSELLDPGILPRTPHLELCTMQVLLANTAADGRYDTVNADAQNDQEPQQQRQQQTHAGAFANLDNEHVFLYKLVRGAVASSYGLHCARLCGVDRAVLMRAADVMALQQAGQPICRLQVPQLEQRDAVCRQLVHRLAGLDVSDEAAVMQLMAAVIEAEAGDL